MKQTPLVAQSDTNWEAIYVAFIYPISEWETFFYINMHVFVEHFQHPRWECYVVYDVCNGSYLSKIPQISDVQNTSGSKGLDKESSKENCSGKTLSINSMSALWNPETAPYLSLKNGSPLFFGSKRLFKHFNVLLAIWVLIAKGFKLCL